MKQIRLQFISTINILEMRNFLLALQNVHRMSAELCLFFFFARRWAILQKTRNRLNSLRFENKFHFSLKSKVMESTIIANDIRLYSIMKSNWKKGTDKWIGLFRL